MGSSVAHVPPLNRILRKSVEWFLRNPANKQTNKQTSTNASESTASAAEVTERKTKTTEAGSADFLVLKILLQSVARRSFELDIFVKSRQLRRPISQTRVGHTQLTPTQQRQWQNFKFCPPPTPCRNHHMTPAPTTFFVKFVFVA